MKAIIIAGGRGERLKPLTNKIPKPMIRVGNKPILEYIINFFAKDGIKELILALCYLPEPIINYFKDGSRFGVKIHYIFEDKNLPLGTAGAILPARDLISNTFIVTYADILRDLQLDKMIKFHNSSKSLVTINIYKHKGDNLKSLLRFSKDNKLIQFKEFEITQNLKQGYRWSNSSFYIFEPEIFRYISKDKRLDFSRDIFPNILKDKKKISVYPSSGYFLDIGTKENLKKLQKDIRINPSILGE